MGSNRLLLIREITDQIDLFVDGWAGRYFETTGKRPYARTIKFVKAMLLATVDFLEQAIFDSESLSRNAFGMIV